MLRYGKKCGWSNIGEKKVNFPQPFHSGLNTVSVFQMHTSASRLSCS